MRSNGSPDEQVWRQGKGVLDPQQQNRLSGITPDDSYPAWSGHPRTGHRIRQMEYAPESKHASWRIAGPHQEVNGLPGDKGSASECVPGRPGT